MLPQWVWIAMGTMAGLLVYQQFRIFQIQRDAKKREELFQIVTENAADMIALVDMKGRRLYNSPAYKKILGYSPAELGDTSSFEQIHPDDRFRILEAAREARSTGVGKQLEYRIKHKDGSWRVLESVASTIRDENGEVSKLVIVNRDISERKRAEQRLEHHLFHDPLTDLPNRRLFLDRLQHAFVRARREPGRQYALLLADVDHFKVFNQTLGAAGGDRVLEEIARRIAACMRQQDTVARNENDRGSCAAELVLSRLGGDEFSILLDNVTDPSDAMRIAKRIQTAVAAPLSIDERELRCSVSIGIALNTPEHRQSEEVLKDAEVALRRAKALGESRCEVFDEAMHARADGRLRLEADLREAFTKRQFRVHYQPVVQIDSRRILSLEALLRWQHPVQGLISPYRFIEVAEDSGVLVSIGRWLLLEACRQLREWEVCNPSTKSLNLTVNASARQFADARLVADLQGVLRETGLDPSRLQLEITESVAASDPKLTVTVLSHLKHMGMGVILDDFGAGNASLRALRQFPIDALKISRSLVQEMLTDRTALDFIEMIITLAHKMDLQVVAGGIETARQCERLRQLGCESGQGHYFSQPMDAEAAQQFLLQEVPGAAR